VAAIEDKVDAIAAYLQGEGDLPGAGSPQRPEVHRRPAPAPGAAKPYLNDAAFDRIVEQEAARIQEVFSEMGRALEQRGYDLQQHPLLQRFVDDPVAAYKQLRRDPSMQEFWKNIDPLLIERN